MCAPQQQGRVSPRTSPHHSHDNESKTSASPMSAQAEFRPDQQAASEKHARQQDTAADGIMAAKVARTETPSSTSQGSHGSHASHGKSRMSSALPLRIDEEDEPVSGGERATGKKT
jgi:hypothetical protein